MENKQLNKNKILQMIANHEITSKQGLQLLRQTEEINNRKTDSNNPSSDMVYATYQWEEKDNNVTLNKSLDNGNLLIFDNDEIVYNLIVEQQWYNRVILVKWGNDYKKIHDNLYHVNPTNNEDYKTLLEVLKGDSIPFNIIYLYAKEDGNTSSDMEKEPYSVFHLCLGIMNLKIKERIQVMLMYRSGQDEIQPQLEAMGAFGKSVHLENPYLCLKTVELQGSVSNSQYLEIVLREMIDNGIYDSMVKYSGGRRYIKMIKEVRNQSQEINNLPLVENGVYIITGGAGGLGIIFANYLARKVKARLILIGRSELTTSIQDRLKELEAIGAKAHYIRADISDLHDAHRIVDETKSKYQQINGLIHCAGLKRDAFLVKKTEEEIQQVLAPKVKGTNHLLQVTQNLKMDFCVLFSSITSVIGNVGQCDYAYANSYMDNMARRMAIEYTSCKIVSINWPLWHEGGMVIDEHIKAMMKKNMGLTPLSLENGLRAFEIAISSELSQLIVLEGQRNKIMEFIKGIDDKELGHHNQLKVDDGIVLSQKDKAQLILKTEDYFRKLLSETTKIPYEDINSQESFEMYGMDSITAMTLNDQLEVDFGELPKTILFEYQNLEELAIFFADNYQDILIKKLSIHLPTNQIKQQLSKTSNRLDGQVESKKRFSMSRDNATAQSSKQVADKSVQVFQTNIRYTEDIAIIGLSGRYPMANDLEEFWHNLKEGKDCITEIPTSRWNHDPFYDPEKNKWGKTNSKWGGFLKDVDKFDPLFFNISPREAHLMDPQERLFLETAWHAVEDAGYSKSYLANYSVGVFVGVMYGQYQLIPAEVDGQILAHTSIYASIANRVSYYMNLHGPSIALDTMCSSSITALHLACDSIRKGESDMVIAGGVNVTIHPDKYIFLSQGSFLSSDGRCRSFGEGGDGYVPSEGVGAVILKSLKKAEEDGDHIYGVIKGSAINHGGKTSGYTVPNPNAQAKAIKDALMASKVDPSTISYLESHGTGTSLGDPIEIKGLTKAYEDYTKEKQYCPIGSVKANIGHSESAAGIASLTKVLLQIKYKQLVPSIHVNKLNPHVKFEASPFYIQRELADWIPPMKEDKNTNLPRRAGISSFGAGGANSHLIIEEYNATEQTIEDHTVRPVLIVLSAKNETQLRKYAESLIDFLDKKNNQKINMTNMAYTLQVGREPMKNRLSIVAHNLQELQEKLRAFLNNDSELYDTYVGTVKGGKGKSELLLNGREGEEFLRIIMDDGKLSKLATLWIMGVDIDWKLLYSNMPRRISLPVYPFEKDRYWLPDSPPPAESTKTIDKLHPLVDKNISDFDGIKYVTHFKVGYEENTSLHLRSYDIEGQNILPGGVLVEMSCGIARLIGTSEINELTDIIFSSIQVIQDKDVTLISRLYPIPSGMVCDILSEDGEVCMQCHMNTQNKNNHPWETIDVNGMISRMNRTISREEFYFGIQELGYMLPGMFRIIEQCYMDYQQIMSYVELRDNHPSFNDYIIYPPILDAIFQLSNMISDSTAFPYAIKRVIINKPLTRKLYLHLNYIDTNNHIRKYDVDIMNATGEQLIVIRGLETIEAQSSELLDVEDQGMMTLLSQLEGGQISIDNAKEYIGGIL